MFQLDYYIVVTHHKWHTTLFYFSDCFKDDFRFAFDNDNGSILVYKHDCFWRPFFMVTNWIEW